MRKDDCCLSELAAIAGETLSGLYEIAALRNDEKAAIRFLNALLRGINLFGHGIPFKVEQPGYRLPVFCKLAKKTGTWPGVLSVDHDQLEANKKIIALLRLGENAPLNFNKKQWTRKTAEVRIALNLLEQARNEVSTVSLAAPSCQRRRAASVHFAGSDGLVPGFAAPARTPFF